jgi:hypothetical protein
MSLNTTQQEILRHGIRWASNIITELAGNYARHLPEPVATHLRMAIDALYQAEHDICRLDVKK